MASLNSQITGHHEVLRRLEQAIESQRLPTTNLLVGPSGVGKFKTAQLLAQKLLCDRLSLCGQCRSCLNLASGASDSLLSIRPEERVIKIDQARVIAEFLQLKSTQKSSVVIIDGVDQMTTQAANSLLKLLEEPAGKSYFLMVASRIGAVLPTILSRSHQWRFGPLSELELKQLGQFSDWAIRAANGSLELAQTLSLPQSEEIRGHAISYLRTLVQNPKAPGHFDEIAEKEKLLVWTKIVMQLFSDGASSHFASAESIHRDQYALIKELASFGSARLDRGFQLTLELEENLEKPLDVGLHLSAFHENLLSTLRGA